MNFIFNILNENEAQLEETLKSKFFNFFYNVSNKLQNYMNGNSVDDKSDDLLYMENLRNNRRLLTKKSVRSSKKIIDYKFSNKKEDKKEDETTNINPINLDLTKFNKIDDDKKDVDKIIEEDFKNISKNGQYGESHFFNSNIYDHNSNKDIASISDVSTNRTIQNKKLLYSKAVKDYYSSKSENTVNLFGHKSIFFSEKFE